MDFAGASIRMEFDCGRPSWRADDLTILDSVDEAPRQRPYCAAAWTAALLAQGDV